MRYVGVALVVAALCEAYDASIFAALDTGAVQRATAADVCVFLGGWMAQPRTTTVHQVIDTARTRLNGVNELVWVGGTRVPGEEWSWDAGPAAGAVVFWRGGRCVFGDCHWVPGHPQNNGCMFLQTATAAGSFQEGFLLYGGWISASCTAGYKIECELPYQALYECVTSRTDRATARGRCEERDGFLATIATPAASAAFRSQCDGYSAGRNYWVGGLRRQRNGGSSRYYWTEGPLGREGYGAGRLFTVTRLFFVVEVSYVGSRGISWVSGRPEGLECMRLSSAGAVDENCGSSVEGYACERVDGQDPYPTPGPGDCGASPIVQDSLTASECNLRGLASVGSLDLREVNVDGAVVIVRGTGGAPTVAIRDSVFAGSVLVLTGEFGSGTEIAVTGTTFSLDRRVEAGQPSDMTAIVILRDFTLSGGASAELAGNRFTLETPSGRGAVIYGQEGVALSGPFDTTRNQATAQGAGEAAFWYCDAPVRITGGALRHTDSTVQVRGLGAAAVEIFKRPVTLSGGTKELRTVAATVSGAPFYVTWHAERVTASQSSVLDWRENAVTTEGTAGDGVVRMPVRVDGPAGVRFMFGSLRSAQATPIPVLVGDYSGTGVLTVDCVGYYGDTRIDSASTGTGRFPATADTVYVPCPTDPTTGAGPTAVSPSAGATEVTPAPATPPPTTFFTAPPGGFTATVGGSSVSSRSTAVATSTIVAVSVVAGVVLLLLLILLIAFIVFAVRRRRRRVERRRTGHSRAHSSRKSRDSKRGRGKGRGSRGTRGSRSRSSFTDHRSGAGHSSEYYTQPSGWSDSQTYGEGGTAGSGTYTADSASSYKDLLVNAESFVSDTTGGA